MTIDDPVRTLERPATTGPALDVPSGWSVLGASDDLAQQTQSPTVAVGDLIAVYGGLTDYSTSAVVSRDGGQTWSSVVGGGYYPVTGGAGATFQGRMWLVGGDDLSHETTATSSSLDGESWTSPCKISAWGPRWAHAVVGFNDKLHLMAGANTGGLLGDVWRFDTDDPSGRPTWNPAGAFGPRYRPAAGVIGGALVVMGGMTDDGPLAEALTSSDGATWAPHDAPWEGRWAAAAVTLGGVLYLIGGQGANRAFNDVWSTMDGQRWTRAPGTPPFSTIASHGATAVGDYILVLGGVVDGQPNRQAYAYRPRGTWTEAAHPPGFDYITHPVFERVGDTIYLINGGGFSPTEVLRYSGDGLNWTTIPSPRVPQQDIKAGVVHNGVLWTSGGLLDGGDNRMCHIMGPAYRWDVMPTPDAGWNERHGHAMASIDGRVWIIAGAHIIQPHQPLQYFGDVWSWRQDTGWVRQPVDPFSPRCRMATCWFKDEFWVLGGQGPDGRGIREAWSTPDGVTWNRHGAPAWGGRFDFGAAVVGDRMYVLLGLGNGGGAYTDVWVTADGEHWSCIDQVGPPVTGGLAFAGFLAQDGRILAIGGQNVVGQPNTVIWAYEPPS